MLTRLPRFLIALALAGFLGLHWVLLQMVAWTGMIVTYSQQAPVSVALVRTFDGKHPCTLCKEITKAKRSEKKPVTQIQNMRLEFLDPHQGYVFVPPQEFYLMDELDPSAIQLASRPPTPPPRVS